jgi:hypothetical protein
VMVKNQKSLFVLKMLFGVADTQHGFESLIRETLGSHDSHIQFSYQSLASDAFVFNDSQHVNYD